MNIRDTKIDLNAKIKVEHELKEIKRLHLHVTTARALIQTEDRNIDILFGYSWETIVMFCIGNTCFITNQHYSVTTEKHKSQMTPYGKYSVKYLSSHIFNYILEKIKRGENISIKNIKDISKIQNIQIIKIYNKPESNIYDYLYNHTFINSYDRKKQIKNLIQRKLYDNNEKITINGEITIERLKKYWKDGENLYKCSEFVKEYKNLSFLNKLNIEKIWSIT